MEHCLRYSRCWNDIRGQLLLCSKLAAQNSGFAAQIETAIPADADDDDAGDVDASGEEILVGVDLSRESMIRAIATDSDSGEEFSLVADDQFVTRQSKIGYYGSLEEGRMIIDDRVLLGLIV